MKQRVYISKTNIVFFLIVMMASFISLSVVAKPNDNKPHPSPFSQPIDFNKQLTIVVDPKLSLRRLFYTSLKQYENLDNIMNTWAEEFISERGNLLTEIMIMLRLVGGSMGLSEKQVISIMAKDIFSLNKMGTQINDVSGLLKVGYRGFSMNIVDDKTVSGQKPSTFGFINTFAESYPLHQVMEFISEALEYRMYNPDVPKVILELTGVGLYNNPKEILTLIREKLGDQLYAANIVLKVKGADNYIIQLAKSLGLHLIHDSLGDHSCEVDAIRYESVSDFSQAEKMSVSIPQLTTVEQTCDKALCQKFYQQDGYLGAEDHTNYNAFGSPEVLRYISRRCGVNSYQFADLKLVPSLEEFNFVLGHTEYLFILNGCEERLRTSNGSDPIVAYCVDLTLAGMGMQRIIQSHHKDPLNHPNTIKRFFKNMINSKNQPCSITYVPYINIFTTACEGSFAFTLVNCIGNDLSCNETRPVRYIGQGLQLLMVGWIYGLTFSSIVSVFQTGMFVPILLIPTSFGFKFLFNQLAIHECTYCSPKECDNNEDSNNQNSCVNKSDVPKEKLWFHQRFIRAAAHDLPELKRFAKSRTGSVACTMLGSMTMLVDHCSSVKQKAFTFTLSIIGIELGTKVADGSYKGIKALMHCIPRLSNPCNRVSPEVGTKER